MVPNKYIPSVVSAFERSWCKIHGPPKKVSGDVEFQRTQEFNHHLLYLYALMLSSPARLHNKTGTMEAKHTIVRHLVQRILKVKNNIPH